MHKRTGCVLSLSNDLWLKFEHGKVLMPFSGLSFQQTSLIAPRKMRIPSVCIQQNYYLYVQMLACVYKEELQTQWLTLFSQTQVFFCTWKIISMGFFFFFPVVEVLLKICPQEIVCFFGIVLKITARSAAWNELNTVVDEYVFEYQTCFALIVLVELLLRVIHEHCHEHKYFPISVDIWYVWFFMGRTFRGAGCQLSQQLAEGKELFSLLAFLYKC